MVYWCYTKVTININFTCSLPLTSNLFNCQSYSFTVCICQMLCALAPFQFICIYIYYFYYALENTVINQQILMHHYQWFNYDSITWVFPWLVRKQYFKWFHENHPHEIRLPNMATLSNIVGLSYLIITDRHHLATQEVINFKLDWNLSILKQESGWWLQNVLSMYTYTNINYPYFISNIVLTISKFS